MDFSDFKRFDNIDSLQLKLGFVQLETENKFLKDQISDLRQLLNLKVKQDVKVDVAVKKELPPVDLSLISGKKDNSFDNNFRK